MTMVTIGAANFWPPCWLSSGNISTALAISATTFDSTTDQVALVARSNVSATIAKIYMRTGTVTTAATMKMGFYLVGTDGRPALTPAVWNLNSTGADPTGDLLISGANTWQTFTLTNGAILVPDDSFAIVLSYVSGSTPSFQVAAVSTQLVGLAGQTPGLFLSNAGAAYGVNGPNNYEWILETSGGDIIYVDGLCPLNGAGTLTAFNTGTVDERVLKFTAPVKMRIIGMKVGILNPGAAASLLFSLWDSTADGPDAQTPLGQSKAIDSDIAYLTTTDGYFIAYFETPYTVAAGTSYYAGVRNTTAVAVSLGEMTTATVTNAIRAFGIGSNLAHLGTRTWSGTNPGAWSDTTTTLPLISLIYDQIDDGAGAGGGGMMFIPNLSGT